MTNNEEEMKQKMFSTNFMFNLGSPDSMNSNSIKEGNEADIIKLGLSPSPVPSPFQKETPKLNNYISMDLLKRIDTISPNPNLEVNFQSTKLTEINLDGNAQNNQDGSEDDSEEYYEQESNTNENYTQNNNPILAEMNKQANEENDNPITEKNEKATTEKNEDPTANKNENPTTEKKPEEKKTEQKNEFDIEIKEIAKNNLIKNDYQPRNYNNYNIHNYYYSTNQYLSNNYKNKESIQENTNEGEKKEDDIISKLKKSYNLTAKPYIPKNLYFKNANKINETPNQSEKVEQSNLDTNQSLNSLGTNSQNYNNSNLNQVESNYQYFPNDIDRRKINEQNMMSMLNSQSKNPKEVNPNFQQQNFYNQNQQLYQPEQGYPYQYGNQYDNQMQMNYGKNYNNNNICSNCFSISPSLDTYNMINNMQNRNMNNKKLYEIQFTSKMKQITQGMVEDDYIIQMFGKYTFI